jgi:hypothetical protein
MLRTVPTLMAWDLLEQLGIVSRMLVMEARKFTPKPKTISNKNHENVENDASLENARVETYTVYPNIAREPTAKNDRYTREPIAPIPPIVFEGS